MSKLKLREYKADDFLNIRLMEYEYKCREGQPVGLWALTNEKAGPAVTMVDADEQIIFCCGVRDMWPGVGEVWAVFSPLSEEYPLIYFSFEELLEITFKDYVRLQTTIDPVDCPKAILFDERLGFKPEGLMKRYGPHGEDRVMYALVREVNNSN